MAKSPEAWRARRPARAIAVECRPEPTVPGSSRRDASAILRSAMHPVLEKVQQRLSSEHMALAAAAREIGVTTSSLTRHLAGEYVRSDSLAKYREWLAQGAPRNGTLSLPGLNHVESPVRARGEMTVVRRASDS